MKTPSIETTIKFGIALIVITIACAFGEIRNYYIKKNGVYYTATIVGYRPGYRGTNAVHEFKYNGVQYEGSFRIYHDDKSNTSIGAHYFIILLPKYPNSYLFLSEVPTWFTLQPPVGGWKTLPTEKQMRTMMDSRLLELMTKHILSPLN